MTSIMLKWSPISGWFDFQIILMTESDSRVDPSFVPETGTLRQSPIEMAEKESEPLMILTRKKLALLMEKDEKEEFDKLLPTISCKSVRFLHYNYFSRASPCRQIERTSVGEHGTLLQEAIVQEKHDFVLLLLKHGFVDLDRLKNLFHLDAGWILSA